MSHPAGATSSAALLPPRVALCSHFRVQLDAVARDDGVAAVEKRGNVALNRASLTPGRRASASAPRKRR